jgi:hypothetical protein
LCKEIDADVNFDALRDRNFRVKKEDIITKIAGAMRENAYPRYSEQPGSRRKRMLKGAAARPEHS